MPLFGVVGHPVLMTPGMPRAARTRPGASWAGAPALSAPTNGRITAMLDFWVLW